MSAGRDHTRFVTESLANHLRQCSYFAATEVPLVTRGAYGAKQRADVYAIKLHEFARKDTRIYEVKTSRADFLGDLEKDKAEGYGDFARRVFYAAPAGLIKKDEVPARIGLIVLSRNGNWTTQKAAAPSKNVTPSADLLLLLMARGFEDTRRARRLRDREVWGENVELSVAARALGHRIATALNQHHRDERAQRAERLLCAFERVHARPDPDTAPTGRRVDREISASKWDQDLDEHVRTMLAFFKDVDRIWTVAQYLSSVTSRWGAVDDDERQRVDRAVRS